MSVVDVDSSSSVSTSSLLDSAEANILTPPLLADEPKRKHSPFITSVSSPAVDVNVTQKLGPDRDEARATLVDAHNRAEALRQFIEDEDSIVEEILPPNALSGSSVLMVDDHQLLTSDGPDGEKKLGPKELLRQKRRTARLIDTTLAEMTTRLAGKEPTYFIDGGIICIRGSFSQFTQEKTKRSLLPAMTHDCCQTFATLTAILMSSFGFVVNLQECWTLSTINYLLYLAAWCHQLTYPVWPHKKMRPKINDLNASLALKTFFPAKIEGDEFDVVFYDQAIKAQGLIAQLCTDVRGRAVKKEQQQQHSTKDAQHPVCGYVIVSGDYTVSVFCLHHDCENAKPSCDHEVAWTLYIADSHGTLPWAMSMASVSGLTLGRKKAKPFPQDKETSSTKITAQEEAPSVNENEVQVGPIGAEVHHHVVSSDEDESVVDVDGMVSTSPGAPLEVSDKSDDAARGLGSESKVTPLSRQSSSAVVDVDDEEAVLEAATSSSTLAAGGAEQVDTTQPLERPLPSTSNGGGSASRAEVVPPSGAEEQRPLKPVVFDFEEGVNHFSNILFALLESHRKIRLDEQQAQLLAAQQLQQGIAPAPPVVDVVAVDDPPPAAASTQRNTSVPYMTWTPIRRQLGAAYPAKQIKEMIDKHWLPHVLSNPVVQAEYQKYGSVHPRSCFWGQETRVLRRDRLVMSKDNPIVVEDMMEQVEQRQIAMKNKGVIDVDGSMTRSGRIVLPAEIYTPGAPTTSAKSRATKPSSALVQRTLFDFTSKVLSRGDSAVGAGDGSTPTQVLEEKLTQPPPPPRLAPQRRKREQ